MGSLAVPSLLAQASMSSIGAIVLDHGGADITFGRPVALKRNIARRMAVDMVISISFG